MTAIFIPHPKTINDMVFNDLATEKRVRQYADEKRVGNIILHGPKGTAKSTTARIIVQTVFDNCGNENAVPELHAKDFVNTHDMERKIYGEWNFQRVCGVKTPYIIINEADQLAKDKQRHLRGIIDETQLGKFIFTTNHIHTFDDPLLDRCDDIEMPAVDVTIWRSKVDEWLARNNIVVDSEVVDRMLETSTGTIRDLKRIVEDIACEFS